MNTALMLDVADHIEHLEWGERPGCFKMRNYTHGNERSCRTPACIAGWTIALGHDNPADVWGEKIFDVARELLGISFSEGVQLFMPMGTVASYIITDRESRAHISLARAAAVLRHLAYTGIVDWSIRPEERAEVESAPEPMAEEAPA